MDENKLHELIGQFLQDLGGAMSVPLVQIGEKLGLYQALDESGASTAQELAKVTGLAERYVREWLCAQAASNYVTYDPATEKFSLSAEQAYVLANPNSPFYLAPAFGAAAAFQQNEAKVSEVFKSGEGIPWGEQTECLACAVAQFFRPGYQNHIIQQWIPALDGVAEKLERGAKVADIGCGHGISTMIMAKAFPNSEFVGLDFHHQSIEQANAHLAKHNLSNLRYEVQLAKEINDNYDFVTIFDCLHDMGDPVGAMINIKNSLNEDGTVMIVEPMAGESLSDNLNPVSRLFYCASTMVCIPTSLAQEEGLALGAQAGEKKLREVIVDGAGYSSFRRATETPFNMILEAKA